MVSFPRRAAVRFFCASNIVLLLLTMPLVGGAWSVGAQDALSPGMAGLVANSGGEPVLLRDAPGYESGVVSSYWEGTPVQVAEGPVYGSDGSAWYGVTIGGAYGYIAAGYLAADWGAVETVPTELAAEPAPVSAETMATSQEMPVTTADLNLRAGPSYDDAIITVIPAGAPLEATGEWANGFAGVVHAGQYGWVDSSWLGAGEAVPAAAEAPVQEVSLLQEAAPVLDDSSGLVGDLATPAGTPAQVIDIANLRLGPSEADEILRVLPAGASLTITGAASGGYTPVWYNGTWGFVSDSLLAAGQTAPVTLAQDAVPQEAFPAEMSADDGSGDLVATTLSDINLRSGPSYDDMVLGIVPAGVELFPYAGPEAGFFQVDANGQTGWVAAEFLQVSVDYEQRAKRNRDQSGKVENSEPADNASAGGGIIWPVRGGSWAIMQGYNGSSHQNQDSLWQYYYSLDIVRQDGETAGQTVYSPVNGVVRWTDPGSGGMSIDMGDGHAVAMFHVAFDGSLQAGAPVSQGQAIGTISGPGGPGFAGTAHIHFTHWTSDDQGNWDREAEPFTGKYAIAGMDFPDIGGGSQYAGTTFYP